MSRTVVTTTISLPRPMARALAERRRRENRTTSDLIREALRAAPQGSLELQLLRSLCISLIGKDPEGEYRPEFVKKILAAACETPTHLFKGSQSFLKELRAV